MSLVPQEDLEARIRRMANEIMDMVVDKALDFCGDKVMEEEDVDHVLVNSTDNALPVQEISLVENPVMVDEGCFEVVPGSEIVAYVVNFPWRMPSLKAARYTIVWKGMGVGLGIYWATLPRPGGPPAAWVADLRAAAAIKEVVVSLTRSSPRLAGVADHHILEKAKLRAAWRNLDHEGITPPPPSSHDYSISSKISNLGVALGCNPKQISDSVSL